MFHLNVRYTHNMHIVRKMFAWVLMITGAIGLFFEALGIQNLFSPNFTSTYKLYFIVTIFVSFTFLRLGLSMLKKESLLSDKAS